MAIPSSTLLSTLTALLLLLTLSESSDRLMLKTPLFYSGNDWLNKQTVLAEANAVIPDKLPLPVPIYVDDSMLHVGANSPLDHEVRGRKSEMGHLESRKSEPLPPREVYSMNGAVHSVKHPTRHLTGPEPPPPPPKAHSVKHPMPHLMVAEPPPPKAHSAIRHAPHLIVAEPPPPKAPTRHLTGPEPPPPPPKAHSVKHPMPHLMVAEPPPPKAHSVKHLVPHLMVTEPPPPKAHSVKQLVPYLMNSEPPPPKAHSSIHPVTPVIPHPVEVHSVKNTLPGADEKGGTVPPPPNAPTKVNPMPGAGETGGPPPPPPPPPKAPSKVNPMPGAGENGGPTPPPPPPKAPPPSKVNPMLRQLIHAHALSSSG